MKNVAVIDLGTNTFHLMIVTPTDGTLNVKYREKVPVKLGEKGINEGVISDAAAERALTTLKHFRTIVDDYGVERIFASATSAFRNASNSEGLIKRIQTETGFEVHIISGEEEAHFIHRGVKKALRIGNETSLILDIGGGSVEFIICNDEKIFWVQSFEIGAQRLLEKFHRHDPILPEEIQDLREYLNEKLAPLAKAISQYQPEVLIGSSGTFDTLVDIFYAENNKPKQEWSEYRFPIEAFEKIYQELLSKDRTARLAIPGMIEMRVDMIVVACILIQHLIEYQVFKKMRVSTYALKEGVLDALLSNELVA